MSVETAITQVVNLCRQGKPEAACELCLQHMGQANGESRQTLLELLTQIYMAMGRDADAQEPLQSLLRLYPYRLDYVQQLSELFIKGHQSEDAVRVFQLFLKNNPDNPNAWFNAAIIYKKTGHVEEAEKAYQRALTLNIEQPEEVHTNLAVMYSEQRREQQAKKSLEQALQINPAFIPALFNLATLNEELGDKCAATLLYNKILSLQPNNIEVMARLIQCDKVTSEQHSLLKKLENALQSVSGLSQLESEAGYFALGKGHDDLKDYTQAFTFFRQANELCKKRLPAYNRRQTEADVAEICHTLDAQWLGQNRTSSTHAPVFICGMFRSGSTLTEQILSAHPQVTTGGELNVLKQTVEELSANKKGYLDASIDTQALSQRYLSKISTLFPDAAVVTDKRPDNFWYLGFIAAAFPNARIICTDRHPLDICLSIYFQHLGNELPYSADLSDIAHYYTQYKALLRHWQTLLPENILCIDYQQLVTEPESTIRRMLDFCQLPWASQCLEFNRSSSVVKTASVWQVRQPLYRDALERWRHYAEPFRDVANSLEKEITLRRITYT
ncbi:sulfotransferase [Lacimicrobium sp. SS2-24]|uniref:tetratricopeptide repeat-containing sulfotransferase family protein n=1 Tax=Lacimicrobium sp. SS2-24 TaxID=2005569 RepID=UPI0011314CC0|nr:sulfotransferase [Lacimicrobium sp. SS2-24]